MVSGVQIRCDNLVVVQVIPNYTAITWYDQILWHIGLGQHGLWLVKCKSGVLYIPENRNQRWWHTITWILHDCKREWNSSLRKRVKLIGNIQADRCGVKEALLTVLFVPNIFLRNSYSTLWKVYFLIYFVKLKKNMAAVITFLKTDYHHVSAVSYHFFF